MSWHELILSTRKKDRIWRHVISWLCWWLFIIFSVFYTVSPTPYLPRPGALPVFTQYQPGLNELGLLAYGQLVLIKSLLLLITHMSFCYTVIYILLPAFQTEKKYWLPGLGIIMISLLIIPAGYFLFTVVYPFIDNVFHLNIATKDTVLMWRGIDASLVNAIKVTVMAVAIVLLKRWWLKQKEKEQLEKEKINAELQLLKAQIHPAFLFSTLNNIITHAQIASPKAPEMLIKLSDILSYMLYECDAPKVKLEKEIDMLREYMALEKIRQGAKLEMTFQAKGKLNGQMICPLLLLPFIDNSFSYSNNKLVEQAWVNLYITVEDNSLYMKLINGLPTNFTDSSWEDDQALSNVKKRLQFLYPDTHVLKISSEQELLMVQLNIKLEDADDEQASPSISPNAALSHA